MKAQLLCVVVMLATLGTVARADKDAEKVIEALIKAHGGQEAHKKYNSRDISFEGTMTIPTESLKIRSQVSFVLPDKSREFMELVDRKNTVEVIVNGDKFKQVLDGKTKELTDEVLKAEYKQNMAINDVTQFYTLLDEKVYSVKSGKDELVNDRDTSVVMVTRVGMREIKLNVDKETSRLVRYSYKARHPLDTKKQVLQESYQSDFKDFKGLLLPTTVLMKLDGKEFMKLKVTDVKLAEKPDLKIYKVEDK